MEILFVLIFGFLAGLNHETPQMNMEDLTPFQQVQQKYHK